MNTAQKIAVVVGILICFLPFYGPFHPAVKILYATIGFMGTIGAVAILGGRARKKP